MDFSHKREKTSLNVQIFFMHIKEARLSNTSTLVVRARRANHEANHSQQKHMCCSRANSSERVCVCSCVVIVSAWDDHQEKRMPSKAQAKYQAEVQQKLV